MGDLNPSITRKIACFCLILLVLLCYFGHVPVKVKKLNVSTNQIRYSNRPAGDELKLYSNTSSTNERWRQWIGSVNQSIHAGRTRRLPDVIGIGVKKCGTGASIRFLAQHPLIEIPPLVETMFFSSNRYKNGLNYYKALMPKANQDQLITEKSPMYFTSLKALQRIKSRLPKVKLILSLCDPIDRAFSDFGHTHADLLSTRKMMADVFHKKTLQFMSYFDNVSIGNDSLHIIVDLAMKACADKSEYCLFSEGIYHPHVFEWQANFNSQLLILNGDDWITKPGKLLESEQRFLHLPELITKDDFVKHPKTGFFCLNKWWDVVYHKTVKERGEVEVMVGDGSKLFCLSDNKGRTRNGVRTMHDKTRSILRRFYARHNLRLYDIINSTFNW